MGFGLLFIGYVISVNFVYYGFSDWLAFLLMFLGLRRLSAYNRGFEYARRLSVLLIAVGAVALALELLSFSGIKAITPMIPVGSELYSSIKLPLDIFTLILKTGFSATLLLGIREITAETGLIKLEARSVWCLITGAVYYVLQLAVLVMKPLGAPANITGITTSITVLYGIVWAVTVAALIFRCYMWICKPGDEKME